MELLIMEISPVPCYLLQMLSLAPDIRVYTPSVCTEILRIKVSIKYANIRLEPPPYLVSGSKSVSHS
jgi:hypothetical protein